VGFNAASLSYIKKKITLAKTLGIKFELHQFVEKTGKDEKELNNFTRIMDKILPEHFELKHFKE
jgi:5,10-methylene-tetrahydrofolate dehydrogenase/methenyl tetrahydrofolate cyclohydrolase